MCGVCVHVSVCVYVCLYVRMCVYIACLCVPVCALMQYALGLSLTVCILFYKHHFSKLVTFMGHTTLTSCSNVLGT